MKDLLKQRPAEYQKSEQGRETVFAVTPASAPKFWYLIVIGGVIFLLGLFGMGPIMMVMGAGAIAFGLFRDMRPKNHRSAATFTVSAESLSVDGKTFRKDEFHRLIIKNPIFEKSGLDVYTSNANVAAGMAQRMKVGELCYALDVEAGGKAHQLAGGLDRTTAFGLLTDVSRILDLKTE